MIIYKIYNTINDKLYIGQTTKIIDYRWKIHCQTARNNPKFHIHRAMSKYGIDNFNIDILEDDIALDVLNEVERKWIAELDSFNNGYNMNEGGGQNTGFNHSIDTKNQISKKLKNREFSDIHKKRLSEAQIGEKNHNFGKNNSLESNEKNRLSNLGKTHTSETKVKMSESASNRDTKIVVQYDKDDNLIKKFNSAKDASLFTDISISVIRKCCNGVTNISAGFKWRYEDE